jgi:hypothetical protein
VEEVEEAGVVLLVDMAVIWEVVRMRRRTKTGA